MRRGDLVILVATGVAGVVARVVSPVEATVRFGEEMRTVAPADVERVQGFQVQHVCGKGRNPFVPKKGGEG